MSRKRSVAGKVVLVTGAARGIGAELASELAARGARVALVGLEPEELAAGAARIGGEAGWWEADVTSDAEMAEVAAAVRSRYGSIDIVVANAGIGGGGTLRTAEPAAYDRVIEVNLLGQVRTARAVIPHLIESRGHYVQVASAAALTPAAVMGSYCASKSGVEAFANALAAEVRPLGVAVTVVYPGWIDTDMVRGADEHPALRTARRAMPWPTNVTSPLGPLVTAMADGIAARRLRVFFPWWLGFAHHARSVVAFGAIRIGGRIAQLSERAAAEHPDDRIGEVGPGGAADEAARARRAAGARGTGERAAG